MAPSVMTSGNRECQNCIRFVKVFRVRFDRLSSARSTQHTPPLNGPFSGTTRVSRYQKGKTDLDSTEATGSEWQWHQLGRMQVCTSLETDNHASTPPLSPSKFKGIYRHSVAAHEMLRTELISALSWAVPIRVKCTSSWWIKVVKFRQSFIPCCLDHYV